MIESYKWPRFDRWFSGTVESRLRGQFSELRIDGLEHMRRACAEGSAVLVSNHTAWWDSLLAIWIGRHTGIDSYAVMDAQNLREHAYFARVGAIGVDLDDPHDGARLLRYGAKLLRTPRRALWVYAQGREQPEQRRPLGFKPGAAGLARLGRATCLPVALRYVFVRSERPVAYVSIGAPVDLPRDADAAVAAQEAAVEAELARIEADLVLEADGGTTGYPRFLVEAPSRLDALMSRLLARLVAPAALRNATSDALGPREGSEAPPALAAAATPANSSRGV